jgi:hypothetical protein
MTHDQEEIIVFRQFENAIDASIAKSKLDAYGVPCFLTEENITNLYPGQHYLPFRVRLHVFKKDVGQAEELLHESHLQVDHAALECPNCRSRNVQRDFPKRFSAKPLHALTLVLFGVLFPHKKVNHCLDCDNEF